MLDVLPVCAVAINSDVESEVTVSKKVSPLFLKRVNRYSVHFKGTNRAQRNDTSFVWFRQNVVENDITALKLYLLYLQKENSYSVCFKGTTRVQTNCTGLERFEWHGVGSDVTQPKNYVQYLKHQTSINVHFCSANKWHSFGDYFFLWGANFTEVELLLRQRTSWVIFCCFLSSLNGQ